MHNITERAHGTRHNGNFLHRLRIFLQCTQKRMTYLVVGNDLSLLLAHHAVFLFLADKHLLHRIKEILLAHVLPAQLHGVDRRLVDHICQIRTDRAGSRQGNLVQIYRIIHQHILGMHL